jgi:hypothetical protein
VFLLKAVQRLSEIQTKRYRLCIVPGTKMIQSVLPSRVTYFALHNRTANFTAPLLQQDPQGEANDPGHRRALWIKRIRGLQRSPYSFIENFTHTIRDLAWTQPTADAINQNADAAAQQRMLELDDSTQMIGAAVAGYHRFHVGGRFIHRKSLHIG